MNIESITILNRGRNRGPWAMRPYWNALEKRWETIIKPGFCNGQDVTIQGSDGDAPLSDRPILQLTSWRGIGPDAPPTGADISSGVLTTTFESVPAFFAARGVGPPPKVFSETDAGLVTENTADPNSRLLRAMELVLYHDRYGASTSISVGTGSSHFVEATVNYFPALNARETAYLRTLASYEPDPLPDPQDILAGLSAQPTRDNLRIATIYLLSQPGSGPQIDNSWQPFVKYHQNWNLTYSSTQPTLPIKSDPISFNTGLAGGIGDSINDALLASVNDQNSQIAQFLSRTAITGTFRMA
jgi:hypothetical protein